VVPAFPALADDTRLRIVELLATKELTVTELVDEFDVTQPAISRHLRVLREAGVVRAVPSGRQRVYRLDPRALDEVRDWADRMHRTWAERFDALGARLDEMGDRIR
jgi:DNA-binding transcriptional ArsR family regulator